MFSALDDIFTQFYQKTKTSKFTDPCKWTKKEVKCWCEWIGHEFQINTNIMLRKALNGHQVDEYVGVEIKGKDSNFLKLWEPFEGEVCLSSWQFLKKTWKMNKVVKIKLGKL